MVCCTIVAALLAALLWPLRRLAGRSSPLAWRPHGPERSTSPIGFPTVARLRSILYAVEGLRFLIRNEHNARLHALVSLGIVGTGGMLRISVNDWRWIVVSIGLVWIGEALNTAVEQLCNLVSPQPHPLIKASKDVAAGAVLVCAVTAAIIGGLTFYPYFGDRAGLICGGMWTE